MGPVLAARLALLACCLAHRCCIAPPTRSCHPIPRRPDYAACQRLAAEVVAADVPCSAPPCALGTPQVRLLPPPVGLRLLRAPRVACAVLCPAAHAWAAARHQALPARGAPTGAAAPWPRLPQPPHSGHRFVALTGFFVVYKFFGLPPTASVAALEAVSEAVGRGHPVCVCGHVRWCAWAERAQRGQQWSRWLAALVVQAAAA